jgi:two-component system LytT family response regulator
MKLLIIENEVAVAENIQHIVASNFGQVEISGTARSTNEALKYCYKDRPDILVMDITLGYTISFELFEYIDPLEFSIIFLSAHREFALEAINYGAVAYIVKPIDEARLVQGIGKAIQHAKLRQKQGEDKHHAPHPAMDSIYLSENHTRKSIKTETLIKIHSDGSYSKAYFVDGKTIHLSRHLGFFQQLLIDKGFIRTHRKSLVNKIHIVHYHPGVKPRITLSDGSEEPLSRTKKQVIIQLLMQKTE